MIDYKGLGERIRNNRKHMKMSQADLAEAAGLSTQYLSEIENCRKLASLTSVVKLSEALGTTLEELIYGKFNVDESMRQISLLLADCTEYERKVLYKNLNELKLILRENVDLR